MERTIIGYCFECKEPIYSDDTNVKFVPGKGLVHFDPDNPINNCYYGNDDEGESNIY